MVVSQVFDILPLYGILMPGESDITTFTFYGHTDIGSEAKALCNVEGGPCYELSLRGEASIVQYDFDTKHIDYGKRVSSGCATLLACFMFLSLDQS